MRLLIMGPPGAGKGTQATAIAQHYGIPAVSTGQIFRRNIADKTPLGLEVQRIIAEGGYVPDSVTEPLVEERLAADDAKSGWLLDGFPRTVHQVKALDRILERAGSKLDVVICLVADPDELVGRMLHRAELEGRLDDNAETIRHRIEVYHTETESLLDTYRQRGLLVEVDAIGEIDEVADRIKTALDKAVAR